MKVSPVALLLVFVGSTSAFAPSRGADKCARVVLQAEPNDYDTYHPEYGILNFQDKLGSYSRTSLSNADTSELTAIHPERLPSRREIGSSSMLPPADDESAPLPPALTNFQDKLGSYSRMSLSNSDTSELTAIHPERLLPRSEVNHAPTGKEHSPRPPALTNFQNELGSYSAMSLSSVDTTELTAIRNFRPEFNKESTATFLPPATEGTPVPPANVQSNMEASLSKVESA